MIWQPAKGQGQAMGPGTRPPDGHRSSPLPVIQTGQQSLQQGPIARIDKVQQVATRQSVFGNANKRDGGSERLDNGPGLLDLDQQIAAGERKTKERSL
jgi:hypothetical protein